MIFFNFFAESFFLSAKKFFAESFFFTEIFLFDSRQRALPREPKGRLSPKNFTLGEASASGSAPWPVVHTIIIQT
jgi:hypothetical protein